ncbi:hypothetical protein [Microcystis phage Mvi-JY20]|uniref:DUF932 domain-containing protein n=1 Tax=Microcystis phage Mvi-JY20 TaxID=3128146 RepID=A0AAX4QG64_9CAUD
MRNTFAPDLTDYSLSPRLTAGTDGRTGHRYALKGMRPLSDVMRDAQAGTYDPLIVSLDSILAGGFRAGNRDRAIIAPGTSRVVGMARDGFTVLPMVSILQSLGLDSDTRAKVTVSADGKSRAVWVELDVTGPGTDPKYFYLTIRERIDASGKKYIGGYSFREWCKNGARALASEFAEVGLRHNAKLGITYLDVASHIARIRDGFALQGAIESELRKVPMTEAQVAQWAELVIPVAQDADVKERNRAQTLRDRLLQSVWSAPGGAHDLGLSAFTALEGITYAQTHLSGFGTDVRAKSLDAGIDPTAYREDRRLEAILESDLLADGFRALGQVMPETRDYVQVLTLA